ncbi:MAG: hypothetical protein ACI9J3_002906 [Parvicellaceae bacterium]|jgi:hypothetical protein
MTLGDTILAALIGLVFFLGIIIGIRLFLSNKKDRDKMAARNQVKRDRIASEQEQSEEQKL